MAAYPIERLFAKNNLKTIHYPLSHASIEKKSNCGEDDDSEEEEKLDLDPGPGPGPGPGHGFCGIGPGPDQ